MKILLDASFPLAHIKDLDRPFIEFERVNASGDSTDESIVDQAAADGFDAVAFLGRQALGRREVVEACLTRRVTLIVTETYNPLDAVSYLRANLGRLRKTVHKSPALLLHSKDVVQLDEEQLRAVSG